VPSTEHAEFRKWVRFYLDSCQKYRHAVLGSGSLDLFLAKLREKRQTEAQVSQAGRVIRLLTNVIAHRPLGKENRTVAFPSRGPSSTAHRLRPRQGVRRLQWYMRHAAPDGVAIGHARDHLSQLAVYLRSSAHSALVAKVKLMPANGIPHGYIALISPTPLPCLNG
jgi:hypothetical protein